MICAQKGYDSCLKYTYDVNPLQKVSIIFQEWTVIKYTLLNVTVHYFCVVMCPLHTPRHEQLRLAMHTK